VDIIQDFIPAGRRNRPGTSLTGPHYVTVHDTGNTSNGANALAHAKYAKSDGAANLPVSWHYTVDDRRIVQHLPLGEVGYHTGDSVGNRSSLGIEIAENADGDRAKAEANAIVLIAELLRTFRLGVSAVVPHKQWNNKQCPHVLLARPGGWDTFTAAISARLAEPAPNPPLIVLDPTPTLPPTPPPTDMQQLQSELAALQSQVAHLEADLVALAKRVQAAATALLQQEGQ
jgi:N-acetylmuramoyl-L-alanine amidase